MAHISSIGAGIYSDLAYSAASTAINSASVFTQFTTAFAAEVQLGSALTATNFRRIQDIREFPQMGTPPNIVNVPVYGSKVSRQVQGQADAPTFEVTINYLPSAWISTADYHGNYVGSGATLTWRFALLNSVPASYISSASVSTAMNSVGNSQYFWLGKMEALQISPQLTDANQATLTVSIQSYFVGPFSGA